MWRGKSGITGKCSSWSSVCLFHRLLSNIQCSTHQSQLLPLGNVPGQVILAGSDSCEPFDSPQTFSTGFSKQWEPELGHCESRSWAE